MATVREIQRRIRSVKNIVKVTGALEAVSASKVRRAQAQVLATRAYAEAALTILRDIALHHDSSASHPLLAVREPIKAISVVVISSDRGLAGPYNTNIIRAVADFAAQRTIPAQFVTVGRKGRDLLVRRGMTIVADYEHLPDTPSILDITPITRAVLDDFLNGVVDEVYIAYTDFVNMITQEPIIVRLLPLRALEGEESGAGRERQAADAVYTYEPNAEAVLNEILPRFTELQVYQAVLESLASEHAARMTAMRNATENGNALVDELTITKNKARQLAITSEMLDIVGGAEALSQSE